MSTVHDVLAAIRAADPALSDTDGHIVVSCDVGTDWPVVVACAINPPLSQDQINRASLALVGLDDEVRAWNWPEVEHKLNCAYRALGCVNPGTGYDYHCGRHPLQAVAAAATLG